MKLNELNQIPFSTRPVTTDSGRTFQMQDCASTAVSSFAWSPTAQELAVLFKSEDRVLYVYIGVTSSEIDALQVAPSKGGYIMREIKAKHEFRKELIK